VSRVYMDQQSVTALRREDRWCITPTRRRITAEGDRAVEEAGH